jgi:TRAP-type C4-dicarboxylate transport system permease small subunit
MGKADKRGGAVVEESVLGSPARPGSVERVVKRVGNWFNWVAVGALLAMFGVITIDILSSKILNRPITATVDIASLLAAILAAFAVSETILAGRHIEVEFIVTSLPPRVRRGFNVFASTLSLLFFLLLVWRCFVYASDLRVSGEASLTQHIPLAPIVYGIGIAFVPAVLIYAVQVWKDMREIR